MTIAVSWREAPGVSEQHCTHPAQWRIVRAEDGELHVLAMTAEDSLRVSTRIVDVRVRSRSVLTCSGREYQFETPPTIVGPVAELMIETAARIGVRVAEDVSGVVFLLFVAATE